MTTFGSSHAEYVTIVGAAFFMAFEIIYFVFFFIVPQLLEHTFNISWIEAMTYYMQYVHLMQIIVLHNVKHLLRKYRFNFLLDVDMMTVGLHIYNRSLY